MRFEQVLPIMQNGGMIARLRWNKDISEGMKENISFVYMAPAEKVGTPQPLLDSGHFEDIEMTKLQHPMKKNRGERISVWSPTVEDLLARDWYVVNFDKEWSAVCGHFPKRKPREVVEDESSDES